LETLKQSLNNSLEEKRAANVCILSSLNWFILI
jgi:hypothetical protein